MKMGMRRLVVWTAALAGCSDAQTGATYAYQNVGDLGVHTGDLGKQADTAGGDTGSGDVATVPTCKPDQCPAPAPCFVAICTPAGACGSEPAPTGSPCSDGDACTQGDHCDGGTCQPGSSGTWSVLYGAASARFNDVLPSAQGDVWAGGTTAFSTPTAYQAWTVRTDGSGKLVDQQVTGDTGNDDIAALAPWGTGLVQTGTWTVSGSEVGWVRRLDSDGKVQMAADSLAAGVRLRALATAPQANSLVAGGYSMTGGKTSTAKVLQVTGDGKPGWQWSKAVPGRLVAVTKLAMAADGTSAALGYTRNLTASGQDLYDLWVVRFDAAGKVLGETDLLGNITASASGLVAAAGGWLALVDAANLPSTLQVFKVDNAGKLSPFATLPGGPIEVPSLLLPGPNGGCHVLRELNTGFDVSLHVWRLDSAGKTVAEVDEAYPKTLRPRIFAASWLGGGSFLLAGDEMLQASQSSWTTVRAWIARAQWFEDSACGALVNCLGDSHGCPPPPACAVGYCDGVAGCSAFALPASTCKP
ncbi:MAG: hypothetical protein HY902_05475 [Deltaproteobacteria bacterium]|nr:hypothetical protein [Deltaproteobacteria bacterium]